MTFFFFSCLYRKELRGLEAALAQSGTELWTHLETPGDLSLPIPTFQHRVVGENLSQGVSEKLPQGIRVSHTSIKGHVEDIQPAEEKEIPGTMAGR